MTILIEPVINNKNHGNAVQAQKFSLKLKITNTGSNPNDEFRLTNLLFKSAEGKSIENDCDRKSFIVRCLNPGEQEMVEVGEYGHPAFGLVTITLRAHHTADGNIPVQLSQKDPYTGLISELAPPTHFPGGWVDFFYIESTIENQQKRLTPLWYGSQLCSHFLL